jgi:hypothetical protein
MERESPMRDSSWRWIALAGLAVGSVSLAGTIALWLRLQAAPAASGASTQPAGTRPAAAPAFKLEGRTAVLARLLAERRAVARITLRFGARGALAASCLAEAAEGGNSACFGAADGAGTWRMDGAELCLAAAAINLAAPECYRVSGDGDRLVLAGSGFLAGAMQLR